MKIVKTQLEIKKEENVKEETNTDDLMNKETEKIEEYNFKPQEIKTIIVRQHNEESFLQASNINFITCEAEVSTIHFVDKHAPITISRTLKSFLEDLHEYGFIKSHHNTVVNLSFIHKIQNGDSKKLLMKNDEIVKLSVRRLSEIRKILHFKNNTY